MSNFKVVDQTEWVGFSWGWYCQSTKHDVIRLKLKQYVEYQGNHEYRINGIAVFVFRDFGDDWWIGANYMDQRNRFRLMGPYKDHEEALTFMLLQAEVDRF